MRDYVSGSLRWAATRPDASALARALVHYRRLAGLGFHHLPFMLVADLALICEQGPDTPFLSDARHGGGGMAGWGEAERALRLRYENQLLGRLLLEPSVGEALDILRHHRGSPEALEQRVARLLELLLRHIAPHYPAEPRLNPAHLRAVDLDADVLAAHGRLTAALEDEAFFSARLEALLQGVSGALSWSQLLLPEDLFELEHQEVLHEEAVRIGCRQLLEIERRLGDVDVRQIAVADEGESESAFIDETLYPTGGLVGLTNRGSLENLVLSELVYIDRALKVDLFDLRLMEGELLYYLRDDGVLRRKRRVVHLLLDADLSLLRKPRDYACQLSILAQGLMLRLTRDLRALFALDALEVRLWYLHSGTEADAAHWMADQALLELLLADELARGLVTLQAEARPQPLSALAPRLREERRKTYAVILTDAPRAAAWRALAREWLEERQPIYALPVAFELPSLEAEEAGHLILPADGAPLDTLSTLKDELIRALVGLRRG